MTSTHDSMQNYFNQNTIVKLPSFSEVSSLTSIVLQLPPNQYVATEYIKNMFEITFQFGIVEKIEQIANTWNTNEYQYVYIVVFNTVFADNPTVINLNNNLINWGYYDLCMLFDNSTSINVRVFYDNSIDNYYKMSNIPPYNIPEEKYNYHAVGNAFNAEDCQTLINQNMESVYNNIRQNYESYESIVESDIKMIEERTNNFASIVGSDIQMQVEKTKKLESQMESNIRMFEKKQIELETDLQNAHNIINELKDNIKWMNKILYQKIKNVDSDLREDFKEFVSKIQTTNQNRRRGGRGRGRNSNQETNATSNST